MSNDKPRERPTDPKQPDQTPETPREGEGAPAVA